MTLEILFWFVMVLWIAYCASPLNRAPEGSSRWTAMPAVLLPWFAAAMLGWKTFHPDL